MKESVESRIERIVMEEGNAPDMLSAPRLYLLWTMFRKGSEVGGIVVKSQPAKGRRPAATEVRFKIVNKEAKKKGDE